MEKFLAYAAGPSHPVAPFSSRLQGGNLLWPTSLLHVMLYQSTNGKLNYAWLTRKLNKFSNKFTRKRASEIATHREREYAYASERERER